MYLDQEHRKHNINDIIIITYMTTCTVHVPSIMDTIGTGKLVLLIEVSIVEGSFNIIKYQTGTKSVPCSEVSFIKGSTVHVYESKLYRQAIIESLHMFLRQDDSCLSLIK